MADDLDVIDPAPRRVRFRDELLELKPLRLGDLPAFSRLVRPVIAEFVGGRHPEWIDNDDLMIVELTELHGESIINAAAIATGRPVAWIADVEDTAELVALVQEIVEVNRDFFIRAMMAEMRAQAPARPVSAGQDGQTPSSTWSQPATH